MHAALSISLPLIGALILACVIELAGRALALIRRVRFARRASRIYGSEHA